MSTIENFDETLIESEVVKASETVGWKYIRGPELERALSDVILWNEFETQLKKINPIAANKPGFVRQVKNDLLNLIDSNRLLIDVNEALTNIFKGDYSLSYGDDDQHITIHLIDFEHPENNSYIVSNHVVYPRAKKDGGNEFDVVYYVNGIPLIVCETKTPFRNAVTAYDGAVDIADTYIETCRKFFTVNLFNFSTEGKRLLYAPIGMPAIKWGPWLIDGLKETGYVEDTMKIVESLVQPERVLDILYNYNIFTINARGKKIKILCRYQQYEGANKLVNRVIDGKIKSGFIWHFQGSGKTYLMLFAAKKLRTTRSLKNPTVMIVLDRDHLNTQSYQNFINANTANVELTHSSAHLNSMIRSGAKKIIITTIQKFETVSSIANAENIIVFVDEAHRTQYAILAQKMRDSLPNAFFFGFTGTPIAHKGRDTFYTFGSPEDEHGYMSKYSYDESVRDHETLEMHFEISRIQSSVNVDALNEAFEELTKGLTPKQKKDLSDEASKFNHVLSQKDYVSMVCEDICDHFTNKIEPTGLKAMIVAGDRNLCVLYKNYLDTIMDPDKTAIVMTVGDPKNEPDYQKWKLTSEEEKDLLERYENPDDPLKILIVTSKLLTGFDSPILQTMYLVKKLKEHTLLQAICRTNRVYTPEKTHGLIVDYMGVFSKVKDALKYSGEDLSEAITNVEVYKNRFTGSMTTCLSYFKGVERTHTLAALKAAQSCLRDKTVCDAFGNDFIELQKDWEAICPDRFLTPYTDDYIWLCKIYETVRPPSEGRAIWRELGNKTIDLIHQNVTPIGLEKADGTVILDESLIKKALVDTSYEYVSRLIGNNIRKRLKDLPEDPFYIRLGNRLKDVQEKYELETLSNEEFLKELLKLAEELSAEEKRRAEMEPMERTNLALTKLFNSLKDQYPDIDVEVEQIVADIDEIIVKKTFNGWGTREQVRKDVKKELKILIKYKYQYGSEVVDEAFKYILTYYNPVTEYIIDQRT